MTKPTKAQLIASAIESRNKSYHQQTVECCGTCRHFRPNFSDQTVGTCGAVHIRHEIYPINTTYLGICDLYKSQKDGAK